ncbi:MULTISPECIES: NAD(P)-dependent alcohol dehydrogenase [Streptomyces]|uniref:NAD(P)-dependent alcohol dehydrogenase n=1 Tax=Streptomyces caniscabiei TaxID=2746961 RepID=A0ABU4MN24_9ACTN|nr:MULTISPECIES: NAD(P)-dependent alcohol dehydrogenase [Streptomyces]MDX2941733.1 NAD(P)-dependent alcohol dehydrogenase [Streptomyces caniscabiei]MDX2951888.1 NAD(P)-dependent alcohol dehydrogenase [Streptomyces caniscabiei]MDX2985953.1 NAD(P)-dependent alcohol dehydrogenase [Streptomyces caniscabiei]MDX3012094.1 NAD(P)-dependent alcohol dehydrogenase [Streptomyces caniscabiei]MDX3038651.1 NAD(P)-dependent alcohol dehydrogenase [Streptomyces caniscabiei]
MSPDQPMMRAVRYDRYGGPEVLSVGAVPRPSPGPGQVLVRVHASSVNPIDVKIRSGGMRLVTGRRFPKRTGGDFAGEVVALGGKVTDVTVGEHVWGILSDVSGRTGAAGEYVLAKPQAISTAPSGTDLVSAAALPAVGITALQALRDTLRLRSGQRLLVVGASGGVGSAAVQLAHAWGAHVTTVAGAANTSFCRELGADVALDYATTPPNALKRQFDAILDCHGSAVRDYRRALRPGGRIASPSAGAIPFALLSTVLPGPRVRLLMAGPRRADLKTLADHVDRKELRPVVERVYPLDEIQDAHRATETGHARGKRVIRLV